MTGTLKKRRQWEAEIMSCKCLRQDKDAVADRESGVELNKIELFVGV